MARARLHLICGNCGCNDNWEYQQKAEEIIEGEVINNQDVWLICQNCSTLHSLNDNAECQEMDNNG